MSIITSQQIVRYFEQYRETDVTFNKQVVLATGLVSRNVYLKVLDRQWSCVVFSSSMTGGRLIINVQESFFTALKQSNNRMTLRWCFKQPDKDEPITFFVPCHAAGFTHYNVQNADVQMVTVEFTQRPPDDLILVLGTLLEAKCNSQQRKDERIVISQENMKRLGLDSRDGFIMVEGSERKCILRDLSFSGARLIVPGLLQSSMGKQVGLRIPRGDQAAEMTLRGVVRHVDEVGGRKDILVIGIEYEGDSPIGYKLLINSFLHTTSRKACPEGEGGPAPERPAVPPASTPEPDNGQPNG
jgi:hypothetical protein